jgi:hypothetical protein
MLHKIPVVLAFLVGACTLVPATVPDLGLINRIEREVRLPPTSHSIDGYDRYYVRQLISGRPSIVGLYLGTTIIAEREKRFPRTGQVHVLTEGGGLPAGIADGGCEEIQVIWDVQTEKVVGVFCNGLA